jgi:hypothetical protein
MIASLLIEAIPVELSPLWRHKTSLGAIRDAYSRSRRATFERRNAA